MKIAKILAGIDFENDTERVLSYASYCAKTFSASLKLLHVIDYLATPPRYLAQYMEDERRLVENKFGLLRKEMRAAGMEVDVKRAIQDLRDIWNRYIDSTKRPEELKFQVEPGEEQVQ